MQPRFAHFSLRPADLDRSARFYADVFEFEIGQRPPFEFDGRWLYLGKVPVLHLIGDRRRDAVSADFLDQKARSARERGSGTVDHVALSLPESELGNFLARLDSLGVPYVQRVVPIVGNQQVFIEDPDGVTIETIFEK
jgi:catechol 2,3-dioxygenase-like lactoylglutathione lyase family enzyme